MGRKERERWGDDAAAVDETPTAPATEAPQAPAAQKAEPQLLLDMYLARRGVPERHFAGMRAHTHVKRATFAQWEEIFKTY